MGMTKATPASLAAAIAATDWAGQDALTDAQIMAAVAADPDAALFTPEEVVAGRVRGIRGRTGLSQPAFAARYGIPVDALRDWEAGRSVPDTAIRSYLRAIGNQPDAVAAAYAA